MENQSYHVLARCSVALARLRAYDLARIVQALAVIAARDDPEATKIMSKMRAAVFDALLPEPRSADVLPFPGRREL